MGAIATPFRGLLSHQLAQFNGITSGRQSRPHGVGTTHEKDAMTCKAQG